MEVDSYPNGVPSWVDLGTSDLAQARSFYGDMFGWASQTYGEGASAYTEAKIGERSVAGMMARPPTLPAEAPNLWAVYFTVTDTDKAVARVGELGGATIAGPMDIEPGRFAVVADPAGAVFHVIRMNEPQS